MNFRGLNFILFCVLLIFTFKFFFSPKSADTQDLANKIDIPGQEFKAPVSLLETKSIIKEVDFNDREAAIPAEETIIYTKNCDYFFSSHGAVLSGVEFKNYTGELGGSIRTIYPLGLEERSRGSFLIALETETPFIYNFIGQGISEENGENWIEFKAENSYCKIIKTFFVSDKDYSIKLKCHFEPKRGSKVAPRIIFPGPRIGSLMGDKSEGFVLGMDGKSIYQVNKDQESNSAWKLPLKFGASDKYFAHAFYSQDPDSFVQRGYFKRISDNELSCFLDCKEVFEPTTVEFNFYVGPKSVSSIKAVDEKLIGLLSFGWFGWLCELLIELIEWLKKNVGNYGLAIIFVALLTRFILSPLSFYARRRFADAIEFEKEHWQELSAINRQYKDNFVKKSEETSKFYEKHGRSQTQKMFKILPLIFEIPIIFASYKILNNYISFYHAPFFLWIKDLSARDPYFLLPVLFGLSFILREQILRDLQNDNMGFARYLTPMILVAFFANLPSGIVLYMFFNSFFSLIEELTFDSIIRAFWLRKG